jgi:hypothetical protein
MTVYGYKCGGRVMGMTVEVRTADLYCHECRGRACHETHERRGRSYLRVEHRHVLQHVALLAHPVEHPVHGAPTTAGNLDGEE